MAGQIARMRAGRRQDISVETEPAREREMVLRMSIGAARGRLIQQMLIESGLVAGAARILGLAFAYATAPSIVNLLLPSGYLRDWRMFISICENFRSWR